jgi:hypothetical protein
MAGPVCDVNPKHELRWNDRMIRGSAAAHSAAGGLAERVKGNVSYGIQNGSTGTQYFSG